jgi:hypothetical protein
MAWDCSLAAMISTTSSGTPRSFRNGFVGANMCVLVQSMMNATS